MHQIRIAAAVVALIVVGQASTPARATTLACTTLQSIVAINGRLTWTVASYNCLVSRFEILEINCIPGYNCAGRGVPAFGLGPFTASYFPSTTELVLSEVQANTTTVELARVKPLTTRVRMPIVQR